MEQTETAELEPHVYWVDEDKPFVDGAQFYFARQGFTVKHFKNATAAYKVLAQRENLAQGVLIVDVMLTPGPDNQLFRASSDFKEEEMGLLLVQHLSSAWLSPGKYPLLVYSARKDGGTFLARVRKHCQEKSLEFVSKSADINAEQFCDLVVERYRRFRWS